MATRLHAAPAEPSFSRGVSLSPHRWPLVLGSLFLCLSLLACTEPMSATGGGKAAAGGKGEAGLGFEPTWKTVEQAIPEMKGECFTDPVFGLARQLAAQTQCLLLEANAGYYLHRFDPGELSRAGSNLQIDQSLLELPYLYRPAYDALLSAVGSPEADGAVLAAAFRTVVQQYVLGENDCVKAQEEGSSLYELGLSVNLAPSRDMRWQRVEPNDLTKWKNALAADGFKNEVGHPGQMIYVGEGLGEGFTDARLDEAERRKMVNWELRDFVGPRLAQLFYDAGMKDIRTTAIWKSKLSVVAFQLLWNRGVRDIGDAHTLVVDGLIGGNTREKIRNAPADGFESIDLDGFLAEGVTQSSCQQHFGTLKEVERVEASEPTLIDNTREGSARDGESGGPLLAEDEDTDRDRVVLPPPKVTSLNATYCDREQCGVSVGFNDLNLGLGAALMSVPKTVLHIPRDVRKLVISMAPVIDAIAPSGSLQNNGWKHAPDGMVVGLRSADLFRVVCVTDANARRGNALRCDIPGGGAGMELVPFVAFPPSTGPRSQLDVFPATVDVLECDLESNPCLVRVDE